MNTDYLISVVYLGCLIARTCYDVTFKKTGR